MRKRFFNRPFAAGKSGERAGEDTGPYLTFSRKLHTIETTSLPIYFNMKD